MGGQGEGTRKGRARGMAGLRGPAQSHGWDRRAGRQRGRRPGRDTGGCHRAAGPTGGRRGRGPSGKPDRGAGGPGGTAGRGKARRKGGRGKEGRQLGDGGRMASIMVPIISDKMHLQCKRFANNPGINLMPGMLNMESKFSEGVLSVYVSSEFNHFVMDGIRYPNEHSINIVLAYY
ncbi:hypothetical protein COCSUDRAFT_45625 [Coccomyxa subellipsoidea C-169]|uniref:Uncharacterized protein n=1 Tax=Coccomyxa subellipsoidea (strain C-169) TaxID=574566 RepID=I0YI59_COCSC|nr:hypothetical protein COCSUDRAFT_45625 [Coccomyxa subellipsoidea C-169]EIE18078.1 hypothetical protein COCSUDRAFT_45625 [Coccomyxa subellipsoidea C-169]|eukprot:XP_005642622.1 hypothetical protein COCSUDRAFT_45625 [Coccomyxa subellipsoidea C-169]